MVQEWGRGILEVVLLGGRLGRGKVFLVGLGVEGNYVLINLYFICWENSILCNITLFNKMKKKTTYYEDKKCE